MLAGPLALPARAVDPCSYAERDDTSNNCDARGSCPADDAAPAEHPATCTFVCATGYDIIGNHPSCSGGSMSTDLQCQQQDSIVGFADASLAVTVTEGGTATLTVTRSGTPRSCVREVTCGQPADGVTECPDNTEHCVFTADADGGSQGSCAVSTESIDACAAALAEDTATDADGTEGDACMALGCTYTHGSLGPATLAWATVDGTAVSTADEDWGREGIADFTAVDDTVSFANNEDTVTIDITALVDGVYDELDKTFQVQLSSPVSAADSTGHVQMHLGDAATLVATVTIEEAELCAGWPAALPARAVDPCSYAERDDTSNNCLLLRGSCPADWRCSCGAPGDMHVRVCHGLRHHRQSPELLRRLDVYGPAVPAAGLDRGLR